MKMDKIANRGAEDGNEIRKGDGHDVPSQF
jgi:hypothetical protein